MLLDLSGHLYPEHQQLLADCYLAMKESDPAKIEALADRLDGVVREDKLGRLGIFGRKLFPDHRIVAQMSAPATEAACGAGRLVRGITPTTPKAECEKLLCDYFDAYLAWDTAHGWHELWGWKQWPPSDPRFPAVAAQAAHESRQQVGGGCLVSTQVARTLSAKYDERSCGKVALPLGRSCRSHKRAASRYPTIGNRLSIHRDGGFYDRP